MPSSQRPARRGAPSRSAEHNSLASRLKQLIDARVTTMDAIDEWQSKHERVFDHLDTLEETLESTDTQIKDLLRSQYKDGSKRGIFKIYDEEPLQVTATVKYGKDTIEGSDVLKMYPNARRIKGLIETEYKVDMKVLDKAVEAGELPEAVYDLIEPGHFMTPSITIKKKAAQSTVIED